MRAASLVGLLALVAGCGMAEYEQKMQESEKRSARFDEQAKLLGPPLEIPFQPPKDNEKHSSTPMVPLFLRPPRGIVYRRPREQRSGGLFVYPSADGKAAAPFTEMLLAFGKAGDKGFHDQVVKAIPATKPPGPSVLHGTRPPMFSPIRFSRTMVEAADLEYSVNTWTEGTKTQVSVIYGWNKAQRMTATKTVDLSLETFVAGEDQGRAETYLLRGGPLGWVPR